MPLMELNVCFIVSPACFTRNRMFPGSVWLKIHGSELPMFNVEPSDIEGITK